jgi:hypothetical protein
MPAVVRIQSQQKLRVVLVQNMTLREVVFFSATCHCTIHLCNRPDLSLRLHTSGLPLGYYMNMTRMPLDKLYITLVTCSFYFPML